MKVIMKIGKLFKNHDKISDFGLEEVIFKGWEGNSQNPVVIRDFRGNKSVKYRVISGYEGCLR